MELLSFSFFFVATEVVVPRPVLFFPFFFPIFCFFLFFVFFPRNDLVSPARYDAL